MKKKIIVRCLIGAPIGLAISTLITVIISLTVGDGNFYAVVPELIDDCGTEMNAVLLQTILSLIYGAAFAGASVIWENDNWSLLAQTLLHLAISSLATFPTAYFCRWMRHDVIGILSYFGIFFGIYVFIWISLYSSMRRKICQMNEEIQKDQGL